MSATVVNFADALRPPLPGELLARYEVMERLSRSNQAETFIVKSKQSGGALLAKLYQKPVAAGMGELDMLQRLDHPAIPQTADGFETADTVCVIREYIEGLPLDKLDVPLDGARVLDIGLQLCDVLGYLHGQSPPVIHRDVKPQNVILDGEGKVHLIDFGISRHFSDGASDDTAYIGTKGYAPPEQYGYKQTDCRADIYSLGILLCFLLTGKQDLDALDGAENQRLARVIRKCAEFAPKDRYPTAEAVKRALEKTAGRNSRRGWIAAALLLPAIVAAWIVWPSQQEAVLPPVSEGIVFAEPLIEQAARLALGLDDDAVLTEYDLSLVDELYIGYDKAFENIYDYWSYGFFSNGDLDYTGAVVTLEDLRMMPSLERLYIHNQQITDIGPLSELAKLRELELEHIPVSDLSPLEGLQNLEDVNLTFGTFTDISPLTRLPNLTKFHVVGCPNIDVRQLRDFHSLRELAVLHPEYEKNHYKYLPEIPLELLKIENSVIDSFEWFAAYKSSLRTLHLDHSNFSSLEGIEEFTELQRLIIIYTEITDLTPLLALPNLEEVQIDSSMQDAAEAIRDRAGFDIVVI